MSDELKEAASRAVYLSQTCKPEDSESEENTLLYQLGAAILAGPRWHDKPPVPGMYAARDPGSKGRWPGELAWIESPESNDGVTARYFGPIPPDPG